MTQAEIENHRRAFRIPGKVKERKHIITDEVTELTEVYNMMTDELVKQYTSLEHQVDTQETRLIAVCWRRRGSTYLRRLFSRCFKERGFKQDNVFDWTEKRFRELQDFSADRILSA